MAQSLFMELKNQDPACRIDVLVRAELFPLVERMPQVAESIILPPEFEQFGVTDCLSFARKIRASGYSHSILLSEGWRSAWIPMLARIAVRTGYAPKSLLNDFRTAKPLWTPMERFVALGLESASELPAQLCLPDLDIGLHQQFPVIEKFSIKESSKPVLALCPGGGQFQDDQWGAPAYASVACGALDRGWQVWLLGDENDHTLARHISDKAPDCRNFIGETTLADSIDLLSLSDVVLTNFSGLMHIALALHRQVLIVANFDRVESLACTQQLGASLLRLSSNPDQVLAELPGG